MGLVSVDVIDHFLNFNSISRAPLQQPVLFPHPLIHQVDQSGFELRTSILITPLNVLLVAVVILDLPFVAFAMKNYLLIRHGSHGRSSTVIKNKTVLAELVFGRCLSLFKEVDHEAYRNCTITCNYHSG